MFTIFSSNYLNNRSNTLYLTQHDVHDKASLREAVCHDYVCAEYSDFRRSNANFKRSNTLAMDCDNDHSDNPDEWVTPEDVAEVFPDVTFGVHYSRNHMREKDGKSARPKFHVFFPICSTTDSKIYTRLKQQVLTLFPYFDKNAADAGRFFFGTADPQVDWHDGTRDLSAFLSEHNSLTASTETEITASASQHSFATHTQAQSAPARTSIPVGSRNSTLYAFAVRTLKRYGNDEQARQLFRDEAAKCEQPLTTEELNQIYKSALAKYKEICQQDDYIPPAQYNAKSQQKKPSYIPDTYTDVGQAEQLAKHYRDRLRYSPATSYIIYKENYWQESEPLAQACAQELTKFQLEEARLSVNKLHEALAHSGVPSIEQIYSNRDAALANMNDEQKGMVALLDNLKLYRRHALSRQSTGRISACLKEARPMILVDMKDLDRNPFLLNTPGDTYDLTKGLSGARPAAAEDLMTRITAVTPSEEGKQIWLDALDTIFCKDQELIDYVQMVCGLAAVGQVNVEALICAWGGGRNGKSTFFNTVSRVLGGYSGSISADTLTIGCMRNIKPELAEARGKRLLIAAELPEGARLNDSIVKQLCSTDPIFAEKKYRDPFLYIPSHTLVLYTNHLPKVDARDDGTWRRLIVIPFKAKIEGQQDKKNYANYLFENAGGAVLSWVIEGAKKVIDAQFILTQPKAVVDATELYRAQSDWFGKFLSICCEIGPSYSASSSELYQVYRQFSIESRDPVRSTTDFYDTLGQAGYYRFTQRNRMMVRGLRIKTEDGALTA